MTFDLLSVQYHSLKAGYDYGQYVRDAKDAGMDDVASFFGEVMAQDAERAWRCHEFLGRLQAAASARAGRAQRAPATPRPANQPVWQQLLVSARSHAGKHARVVGHSAIRIP